MVSSVAVSPAASSALMPLHALVDVAADVAAVGAARGSSWSMRCAVKYAPVASSRLPALWSEVKTLNASSSSAQIAVARLRPNTLYSVELVVLVESDEASVTATSVWRGSFTSACTGYARFDSGPYGWLDSSFPSLMSFEVATFTGFELESYSEDPLTNATKTFNGLVGLDAEGWVVWLYHLEQISAWDFLPESEGGGFVASVKSAAILSETVGGTFAPNDTATHRWTANSELRHVGALGEELTIHSVACTGRGSNYNQASHECRVDTGDAELKVWTTQYEVRTFADEWVPVTNSPGIPAKPVHADAFAGAKIVRWDRTEDVLETIYDMFDFADPTNAMFASTTWTTMTAYCSGDGDGDSALLPTFDYHHIDAVSLGAHGDLIVSSRTLNTVWALKHDGSGVRWALSSSLNASNFDYPFFDFQRDADKFYSPHATIQQANGRILVVDDGDSRPGCTTQVSAGCFSRLAEYALDETTMQAELVWQFEWALSLADNNGTEASQQEAFEDAMLHDGYNPVGGSVYELDDDRLLLAFTSVAAMQRDWNPAGSSPIFELAKSPTADADSESNERVVVAKMLLPNPLINNGLQNGYRFVPWSAIKSESHSDPFATSQ